MTAAGLTNLGPSAEGLSDLTVKGAGVTKTVAVLGAAFADLVRAAFPLDLQGVALSAWVSATDELSVRFQNGTGVTVDLASGTLRVTVEKAWAHATPD